MKHKIQKLQIVYEGHSEITDTFFAVLDSGPNKSFCS